jgi:RNase P subunit RPR2
MPNTIRDGQQFPIACPSCHKVAGMPFMAGTTVDGGVIRVGMRCRECNHEWRFDMPVTVSPKRDSGTDNVIKPSV